MSNGSSGVGELTIAPRFHKFIGECPETVIEVAEVWSNYDDAAVEIRISQSRPDPSGPQPTADTIRQTCLLNDSGARALARLILQATLPSDDSARTAALAEALPVVTPDGEFPGYSRWTEGHGWLSEEEHERQEAERAEAVKAEALEQVRKLTGRDPSAITRDDAKAILDPLWQAENAAMNAHAAMHSALSRAGIFDPMQEFIDQF